jgi:FtsZ-binding cell division protein ZapB/uncharacterized coiled-coil protein SlyX
MAELLDASYTLGVTFLLVTMIVNKIKKLEGIETEEITIESINKYLPEIEKYLPEIRKQLPELTKYIMENSIKKSGRNDCCECHKDISSSDEFDCECSDEFDCECSNKSKHIPSIKEKSDDDGQDDSNISQYIPVKHIGQKWKQNKNECINDEYRRVCEDKYTKFLIHKIEHNKKSDSESHKSDDSFSECDCESRQCNKCNRYSNESDNCENSSDTHLDCEKSPISEKLLTCSNEKTNEINDRIIKIKLQLDRLSDLEEEQCEDDDDYCDDKAYIEHIGKIECREISEDEEKCAANWDLCELKKTHKPCKYECGQFAIDEDLNVFKNKVIKKAEIIISCYKKKLLECEKNKCHFEKCLQKCKKRSIVLEKELGKCHNFLKCCEEEKKEIMRQAKKCEKELACLLEKYFVLECDYKRKKEELEKCHNKNKHLVEELHRIKCELDICLSNKNKLKEQVEHLYCALESCKKDKARLLEIISKLEEKLKKCEHENTKLECLVRELKEEIHKLNKKVKLLIHQNKELAHENADLKKQLGKTLTTLKCLCDKYNALKEKCKHKKCNCC